MKTLFLAPESPYPAHGGGPMRSACVLEWLSRKSEVHALVFSPPGSEIYKRCRRVEVVELPPHSNNLAARSGRNLSRAVRGVTPLIDRFSCAQAKRPLQALLEDGPFDWAVFEHFWSSPWIRQVRPHCRLAVLDLHNRESDFYRAMGGPLAGWFTRCARRWEAEMFPLFDQIWDPESLPTGLPLRSLPEQAREFDLAFSGTLAYPPNRDALAWFHARIWPRIVAQRPGARWVIIGKNAEAVPKDVAHDPRIVVTGPVEDAALWLGRSRLAIAPMRRGAGVSVKIVEAWQAGCPVVATTIGARGYREREALVIADSPEEFSARVLELLDNEARRARLGRAARSRFETDYSWPAVHQRLDQLMSAMVAV